MLRNVSREERGEQTKILVNDFRKIFARHVSKVELHRRRLQRKVCKKLKVGVKFWKR